MTQNINANLPKENFSFACAERSHLEILLRELQRMPLEAQAQQIITDFLFETLNLYCFG